MQNICFPDFEERYYSFILKDVNNLHNNGLLTCRSPATVPILSVLLQKLELIIILTFFSSAASKRQIALKGSDAGEAVL